jgi:hypothetical protein
VGKFKNRALAAVDMGAPRPLLMARSVAAKPMRTNERAEIAERAKNRMNKRQAKKKATPITA